MKACLKLQPDVLFQRIPTSRLKLLLLLSLDGIKNHGDSAIPMKCHWAVHGQSRPSNFRGTFPETPHKIDGFIKQHVSKESAI